ncbi:MAG TPA: phosphoribosylformylglycinamidine synthase subunit PurQ [Hyphomicrobiales bacterium]|nr:phosphoribosylformylglycinamidine synthase subunit PurQ [Hyphomicrobiales bacterium]
MRPRAAIILFPGINRERDMGLAVKAVSGREPEIVWYTDSALPDAEVYIIAGGFSYGDYLRSGAIAARAPVMADLLRKAEEGATVLGICNGFQILTEAGLLPGALMRNAGLKFVCKDVHLRVERSDTRFTRHYRQGQVIRVPVAHGDGNYFADEATLKRLNEENRVLFRYCAEDGTLSDAANPNGSIDHIAGIINEAGNVLGMMPHPEDLIDPLLGGTDGRALFESVLEPVGEPV